MRVPPYVVIVSELGRRDGRIRTLVILVRCVVKHIALIGTAHWTVTQVLMMLTMMMGLLCIATAFEHEV